MSWLSALVDDERRWLDLVEWSWFPHPLVMVVLATALCALTLTAVALRGFFVEEPHAVLLGYELGDTTEGCTTGAGTKLVLAGAADPVPVCCLLLRLVSISPCLQRLAKRTGCNVGGLPHIWHDDAVHQGIGILRVRRSEAEL